MASRSGWRRAIRPPIQYLYSDNDIAALLAAAGTIRSVLRAATNQTLIGLLSLTGMRIGEVISLDRSDLDLRLGLLVVRSGKFGKSRQLSLHGTNVAALRDRPADSSTSSQPEHHRRLPRRLETVDRLCC